MQFASDGPDIPDTLLEAHEDGRVVFFCGAGISYPAGLPGFKGLVDEVYKQVGSSLTPAEKDAYDRSQYDGTLDLLERRLPGHRASVRKAIARILQPNLRKRGATDTHKALIQLARTRDNRSMRLVTTNFDRVFAAITAKMKPAVNSFAAPYLPIAKNSRWDGLVYLHGLLPKDLGDTSALNRLVFTSGDFGLAYLTERWASRFVAELFRNYVVCFVGYSINDPVLRYMMDAIAADRMLGEMVPQAYAFGDCLPGDQEQKQIEWEAKGVRAILYEVPIDSHDHSALHRTIKAWSEIYRDGILGKERIVVQYGSVRPSDSTQQDDFVGRMLWAIADSSGLPSKAFAELDPVPPLDWLEPFSENRFGHSDLKRFGVAPHELRDERLEFSLLCRPAPYSRSGRMRLVSEGARECDWDEVMFHLGRWLLRHLNDPNLILWIVKQGGAMQLRLAELVENQLNRLSDLRKDGNWAEIEYIKARSPNAIPQGQMLTVWQLFLNGRVKSSRLELRLYQIKGWLFRDGLTPTIRFRIRELLAPKVQLRKSFGVSNHMRAGESCEELPQLIELRLVLASDHAHSSTQTFAESSVWHEALPKLVIDFERLLVDALDLLREIGQATERTDGTHWDIPSIEPHSQNQTSRSWAVLVDLLRDSWLALRNEDDARAREISYRWFSMPYPLFKRLGFYAAGLGACFSEDHWVDWLLSESAWWMWSIETKREVMRLLSERGKFLGNSSKDRLEVAVLAGPPREMLRNDIDEKDWIQIRDRAIWLRLAKLQGESLSLGAMAADRLSELSNVYPAWKLQADQKDEFSFWIGTDEDSEIKELLLPDPADHPALVKWLKDHPAERSLFERDSWAEVCRSNFSDSLAALKILGREGIWPAERWSEALQAWAEEERLKVWWLEIAPVVSQMPLNTLKEATWAASWWLEAVSKISEHDDPLLVGICKRIMTVEYDVTLDDGDLLTHAINHPIGRSTEAMLHLWFRKKPSDGDGVPDFVKPVLQLLVDTKYPQFRPGRIILASRLVALFRVDQPWTEEFIIPLFDWARDEVEAQGAWEGFLWSPRLYPPLFRVLKTFFLETSKNYDRLGDSASQFVGLFTFAALEPEESYTVQDFREAFLNLPAQALLESAEALVRVIDGAGERREEYWTNRIRPFLMYIWPHDSKLLSAPLADVLARLAIAAGDQFPDALETVVDWLQPVENALLIVHQLKKSGLAAKFPAETVRMLAKVVGQLRWIPPDLGAVLDEAAASFPNIKKDPEFVRLMAYFRKG